MTHRYNLRSKKNHTHLESEDITITLSIKPSWSYGISSFNTKKTFMTLDKDDSDKHYTFEFDRKDTVGSIREKILKEITITPKGILKDNLNIIFVSKEYKKPVNYEIKGEISHMKDYPVKGFNDFFNKDALHKTIDQYLIEGDTTLTLYYHISGSFVTDNMCIIS